MYENVHAAITDTVLYNMVISEQMLKVILSCKIKLRKMRLQHRMKFYGPIAQLKHLYHEKNVFTICLLPLALLPDADPRAANCHLRGCQG